MEQDPFWCTNVKSLWAQSFRFKCLWTQSLVSNCNYPNQMGVQSWFEDFSVLVAHQTNSLSLSLSLSLLVSHNFLGCCFKSMGWIFDFRKLGWRFCFFRIFNAFVFTLKPITWTVFTSFFQLVKDLFYSFLDS